MSRIGRKPIPILKGVEVEQNDGRIRITGPKGELTTQLHPAINVEVKENELRVSTSGEDKEQSALHGLWRALLNNMVRGVVEGYQKKLEIVGVGYRAEIKGSKLQLQVGYSHPIVFAPPEGIKLEAPTPTNIVVSGVDRQLVGQVAAKIRSFRPPEPYKGKGIKYEGEYIRKKAGKAAAAAAGTKQ
jgi:large subunit ribosomal protein L6